MSTGVRVPRHEALQVARSLVEYFTPATHRIVIAGSLRRVRPDVGDIELVAVPVRVDSPDGFFAQTEQNLLTLAVDDAIAAGTLTEHPDDPKRGERYSKLLHPASGLQVDLFSAREDTFGLILLIRTGPAEYSHRFVTDLRRRGLHVGQGELHRGGLGCGTVACEVIPTPTEIDVYAAARWAWVAPEDRA